MDAVLRVDDKARIGLGVLIAIDNFIHASRAIQPRRFAINRQILSHGNRRIGQVQMHRLVLFMVGARHKHRGQFVERYFAIRPWIGDGLDFRQRLQRFIIGLAMLERAKQRQAKQFIRPHVQPAQRNAEHGAKPRP